MRFNIFGIQERIYKQAVTCSIILLSMASLVIFFIYKSDAATFIISTLYALTLFLVTLYLTAISSQTQNLYYRRKDQYVCLKTLYQVFPRLTSKVISDDDLQSRIIWHKLFTGHMEYQDDKKAPAPIVQQNGFRYTNSYLALEDEVLERNRFLSKEIRDSVEQYIKANNLKRASLYNPIGSFTNFMYRNRTWREQHLELSDVQDDLFEDFVGRLQRDYDSELRVYEQKKRKYLCLNWLIYQNLDWHIKKIERIYGDRLHHDLVQQDTVEIKLSNIERDVTTLKENSFTTDDVKAIVEDKLCEIDNKLYEITKLLYNLNC